MRAYSRNVFSSVVRRIQAAVSFDGCSRLKTYKSAGQQTGTIEAVAGPSSVFVSYRAETWCLTCFVSSSRGSFILVHNGFRASNTFDDEQSVRSDFIFIPLFFAHYSKHATPGSFQSWCPPLTFVLIHARPTTSA